LGDEGVAILIHEVWIDSEGMPGLCLAGPMGDGFRALEREGSELVATIAASCRFEAMTKYYELLGRGPYTNAVEADHEPYSEEWRAIQLGEES
jgi:hypothetical protein